MKIVEQRPLAIPGVMAVRFARFRDMRGYFTETYRRSDFEGIDGLKGLSFVQGNESFSRAGVVRGLHFQWNPFMGKLVRTVHGRMVDLFLDVRKGSPTFGKIAAHDMPSSSDAESAEWIWVPPGFAHGNFFSADSTIEYLCSGEYSPGCEAGVSPFCPELDWSLCDPALKAEFDALGASAIATDKDRNGFSLSGWAADPRSGNFVFGKC